jgi:hypothetical protein
MRYTVVGIYIDGEPPEGQALESYIELVDADSPKEAAEKAVENMAGCRQLDHVIAIFEGEHCDTGPCTIAYEGG